ncbi:MAG: hypothetical protein OEX07_15280, partial [Gammaproteobacteria bacterium]|nr:hypothetical protein [Gammaproteobacteria bacterium]
MNKLLALFLTITLLPGCFNSSSQSPPTAGITSSGFNNASFTTTHFAGSQTCSICHNGLTDINGIDVSIE